jgi:hypothetical protein
MCVTVPDCSVPVIVTLAGVVLLLFPPHASESASAAIAETQMFFLIFWKTPVSFLEVETLRLDRPADSRA